MLQDRANDEMDQQLINFVWQRRGEAWAKLEKFEDAVERQFEELRMSLVAHAHHAQAQQQQEAHMRGPSTHGSTAAATTPIPLAAASPSARSFRADREGR